MAGVVYSLRPAVYFASKSKKSFLVLNSVKGNAIT
jgi:hypothetical protein